MHSLDLSQFPYYVETEWISACMNTETDIYETLRCFEMRTIELEGRYRCFQTFFFLGGRGGG